MTKKINIQKKKKEINDKHILFYDKTLSVLEFMLDQYSKEIEKADIEFLETPKNTIATLDFLISSIGKVQKGQRLALGLDNDIPENLEPVINIIEGLSKEKI